jgi:hypothetical protein
MTTYSKRIIPERVSAIQYHYGQRRAQIQDWLGCRHRGEISSIEVHGWATLLIRTGRWGHYEYLVVGNDHWITWDGEFLRTLSDTDFQQKYAGVPEEPSGLVAALADALRNHAFGITWDEMAARAVAAVDDYQQNLPPF